MIQENERTAAASAAFAAQIGLDPSYVSYCRTKWTLETFGRLIANQDREAYQRNSIKLCLADAKARLAAVNAQ